MKKPPPAESPDAYFAALGDWRKPLVESLRRATLSAAELEERIKWGHLVYFSNAPVLLIRAEDRRVLLGFWRGKRLGHIEARLKPGGKYELATMALLEGDEIAAARIRKLVRATVDLNRSFGDPMAASGSARLGDAAAANHVVSAMVRRPTRIGAAAISSGSTTRRARS